MKFSLAANYDPDLVRELARFPVREVYGKLPVDPVGGGRPSYMGSPLDWPKLEQYVQLLSRHGIDFNYLLNSSCHGNREWGRTWQRRFNRLLERIGKAGITRVTVSTPYLLETVKARFPSFRVRVGIYAQVDTPSRARFWEDLGADAITLESFSVNRNLARLRAIRSAVSCELQLIANHSCLPNCPLQPYHQNGFAHSSQGGRELFIDYCILRCARLRLEHPALFVKAAWIRPEDLASYEQIGFDCFKLLERGIPSEELLYRLKAYSSRSCQGDLARLILSYGFKEPLRKERWWGLRYFFRPGQASPFRLRPLLALARQQGMLFAGSRPVSIDNRRIPPDFLARVTSCDGAANGCGDCRYCDQVAAEAVMVDEEFRRESLRRFAEADQMLVQGGLWHA